LGVDLINILKVFFKYLFGRSVRPTPPIGRRDSLKSNKSNSAAQQTQFPVKKSGLSTAQLKENFEALPKAKVIRVLDGDSLIVRKGRYELEIRLDSIDCPEDGQPWGDKARFGLVKLVGGQWVSLEEHGMDHYGRTLATIFVRKENEEIMNVNERMVMLGHAWFMRHYSNHLPFDRIASLSRIENWAKSKRVGLWRTVSPIPPWAWRKDGRNLS
jgi:micrococcal nuclease